VNPTLLDRARLPFLQVDILMNMSSTEALIAEVYASLGPEAFFAKSVVSQLLAEETIGRGAVVMSISTAPAATRLGAALELMYVSVHKLHLSLDNAERADRGLGVAGDVLIGDYLSSAAFQLLVRCQNLQVMKVVSEAVQRACEAELVIEVESRADRNLTENPATYVRRAAPLGEAAGLASAALGDINPSAHVLAGKFGRDYCAAQALAKRAVELSGTGEAQYFMLATNCILDQAKESAIGFSALTGNPRPLALCTALQASCVMTKQPESGR
jgi:octaprenyl-diphosphate synthase